jgi:hypothetical protein
MLRVAEHSRLGAATLGTTIAVSAAQYRVKKSGLTPGQSYTWKLAHRVADGGAIGFTHHGPNHGKIRMQAFGVLS